MKSILFEVNYEHINCSIKPSYDPLEELCPYLWHINIPILSALSVEYFSVQDRGSFSLSSLDTVVAGDTLIMESAYPLSEEHRSISVVVHYNGIRDYSLLFPWVSNVDLKRDLGLFYEEAEKNFEQGAWLSFALMCGAVFEGMLYAKLNYPSENGFNLMITRASNEENNILNASQKEIMDKVRILRNRVHCNKFDLPYVSRVDAMDIKSLLDRLIKDFSL
ncbi:DUF4145 domain-containing protein [Bacillus cereus]|uniref:DUF4145 domain-containing protein n=1 Tax=Bacillus cereus TaxID=1396 RepID=UPI000BF73963|nr:DUF4145 domain-containing protein [Bacillus cereus]MEB9862126.1 DUF4145 domain-containing protein [Bacillus cereus]PFL86188.1 DUF4145 domain-containing protein [Bacillus cereus]PFU74468.1 DUF4145 domain-containing protein [Bacillus cereus]